MVSKTIHPSSKKETRTVITFGFEREFFVVDRTTEELALPPSILPLDGCGMLAEARSKPFPDPYEAACSLQYEVSRMERALDHDSQGLCFLDLACCVAWPDKVMRRKARQSREYTKGPDTSQNLYGYESHAITEDDLSCLTAGLHVSVRRNDGGIFDFPQLIRLLDVEFRDVIRTSGRSQGFYRIMNDGRVEHRSLPQSVDIMEVAKVLTQNIQTIHGRFS